MDSYLVTKTTGAANLGKVLPSNPEFLFKLYDSLCLVGDRSDSSDNNSRRKKIYFMAMSQSKWMSDKESIKAGVKHVEGIDGKLNTLVNNARFGGSLRDPSYGSQQQIFSNLGRYRTWQTSLHSSPSPRSSSYVPSKPFSSKWCCPASRACQVSSTSADKCVGNPSVLWVTSPEF
ncbi:hypothetical protein DFS33DRAFT_1389342 [Desarmillaria ectypa]|nr:hypothetical protein DFS33DRAFT_1389342 [Desarmillaria ectypa]